MPLGGTTSTRVTNLRSAMSAPSRDLCAGGAGAMTALGGLGHALPYLIPNFSIATSLAFAVVAVELIIISWIRTRYMDTPFLQAAFQVVVGGVLVFAVGILIGNS